VHCTPAETLQRNFSAEAHVKQPITGGHATPIFELKERPMRNPQALDQLLENAVATALGLERPHPLAPRKLRSAPAKAARHHHHAASARHERAHAA
jgi:hypothetical protein